MIKEISQFLSYLKLNLKDSQGYTLVELFVVILIIGVLIASAAPSFLNKTQEAQDLHVKTAIFNLHRQLKITWMENDNKYPSSDQVLNIVASEEPAYSYSYRTDAPSSVSTGPTDISIATDNQDIVDICAKSASQVAYCARFDERAQLQIAPLYASVKDSGPAQEFLAEIGTQDAFAGLFVPSSTAYQAFAHGKGPTAELDAKTALSTRAQHGAWDVGVGNSGKPTWNLEADGPDPTPLDTDGDGIPDDDDSCPNNVNSGSDNDSDGVDNVCDPTPNPPPPPAPLDTDGDGIPNSSDSCPNNVNSGQDNDNDGIDNVCDPTPNPPVIPDPPNVQITSGPSNPTVQTSALINWNLSGGSTTSKTCTIDATPVDCTLNNFVNLNGLAVGAHVFQVTASGPGGQDSDTYNWSVADPPNDLIVLDGNGDYADTPGGLLSLNTTFEVGGWVKINSLPTAGNYSTITSQGCVSSNSGGCGLLNSGWALMVDSTGKIHFEIYGGLNLLSPVWLSELTGGASARAACFAAENGSNATLAPGQWNYISGHFQTLSRIRVYLNGRLQACSGGLGSLPLLGIARPIRIGGSETNTGTMKSFWNGKISEVRMTIGGVPAHPSVPGPKATASSLYSPAENGRPAEFLYSFSGNTQDSMGRYNNLTLRDNAFLGHD